MLMSRPFAPFSGSPPGAWCAATWLLAVCSLLPLVSGCSLVALPGIPAAPLPTYVVFGKPYQTLPHSRGYVEIGIASWYGADFHGKLTSTGEVYDMYAYSAAHKSLPLPSVVRVTNLNNGLSLVLRVNDRGPFHDDRFIDLSYAASRALGFTRQGLTPVLVQSLPGGAVVDKNTPPRLLSTTPSPRIRIPAQRFPPQGYRSAVVAPGPRLYLRLAR